MTENEKILLQRYTARRERETRIGKAKDKIALALLQQCKDEDFSVGDVLSLCDYVKSVVSLTSLRDGFVP